jgi:hypothetical protein
MPVQPIIDFPVITYLGCINIYASMATVKTKKSQLRIYYERKAAEGKNKVSVLQAVRNKLIRQIFSCVLNNTADQDGMKVMRLQYSIPETFR